MTNWACPNPEGPDGLLNKEYAAKCNARPCECMIADHLRWQKEKRQ